LGAENEAYPGRGRSTVPLTPLFVAGALLVAAYLSLLWSLDGLPFEDTPNHLSRAVVIADLLFHGGRRFGHAFTFQLAFAPYILSDLALAPLVEAFGPYSAGRLWMMLVAASLPVSVAVYLRLTGHSAYSVVIACVLALYLGTDWFFVNGFGSFRLAVAWTLLATAVWLRYLRSGTAWAYLAHVAILVAGYLTHLSALLFSAAAVGTVAVVALVSRQAPRARLAWGGLPLAALFGWHVLSSGPDEGTALWRLPVAKKILRLASSFDRFDVVTETVLVVLFAVACGLMAVGWRRARASARVVTPAVLSLAFLGVYVALPYEKGEITYIDVRAVPVIAIFALLSAVAIAEQRARRSWVVAALAIALAGANLWVLAAHLRPANAEMLRYRAVAARIPPGAVVLPIMTRPRVGRSEPYANAGTLATIEAAAMTPYIFQGIAQPYFRARALPWAPAEYWYVYGADPGDAALIARTYDFVLAMTPFDRARLPVRTEEVARNDAAVLLKLNRSPAHGRPVLGSIRRGGRINRCGSTRSPCGGTAPSAGASAPPPGAW